MGPSPFRVAISQSSPRPPSIASANQRPPCSASNSAASFSLRRLFLSSFFPSLSSFHQPSLIRSFWFFLFLFLYFLFIIFFFDFLGFFVFFFFFKYSWWFSPLDAPSFQLNLLYFFLYHCGLRRPNSFLCIDSSNYFLSLIPGLSVFLDCLLSLLLARLLYMTALIPTISLYTTTTTTA